MRNLTMTQRLWGSVAIIFLAMLVLSGWGAVSERATMLDERRAGLNDAIEMASGVAEDLAARSEEDKISSKEAKRRAASTIQQMTYNDGRGYIYVFNSDYELLAHPRLPTGTFVGDFQNEEGRYLFREFAESVNNDDGVVDYLWAHASEEDQLATKSSAHVAFDPWGWYIGTGVYIEDVNEAFLATLIRYVVVSLLIGVPALILIGLVIRNLISRLGGDPQRVIDNVRQIAQGNFDSPIALRASDHDSLLAHIEHMRQSVSEIIQAIDDNAAAVKSAVDEINAGTDELATRTEQQAASLTETASSMEEMTTGVRQNAESAGQARAIAEKTLENADRGHESMRSVDDAMQRITESAAQMNTITETIESIAFQTNILALNASVEAARAGEQGRGFAVVAEEVRALASRSSAAAKEIKGLIETSSGRIGEGSEKVQQTDRAITAIVEDVRELGTLVGEISSASEEQSSGIEQVNDAVSQMDTMTQQNTNLVQQNTQSLQQLIEQTDRLRDQMANVRTRETT